MSHNAVITGATKGIGLALAEHFAAKGFNLALSARTEIDLLAVQAKLKEKYPERTILIQATDFAKADQIDAFIDKVKQTWPQLDVLINNAGIFYQGAMLSEDADHLAQMMQVNVMAPHQLCRAFAPQMSEAGKGHIFNICSVASQKVFPGSGSYATTKFALLGLTKALRQELLDSKVKVTAVLPGATWTASWEGSGIPPSRLMAPEDVAKAVWQAWDMAASVVLEELVLRPQQGDL